jgi:hypothetical protein
MSSEDWSRVEVEAIVADYLDMLALELAGVPYSKAAHRRALLARLDNRSAGSIEFKHANISAVLLEAGFPYIPGYKPRANYQHLLAEVVSEQLATATRLHELAAADADAPIVAPEPDDLLSVLTDAPHLKLPKPGVEEPAVARAAATNFIEREARNRSLGAAGEEFIIRYEQARLIHAGCEALAHRIEHTARVRGDHEGYDILSFETDGRERLIEVKTTKYGKETPFFVTRNEVEVSERHAHAYNVYRLFSFRQSPRLYVLPGAIGQSCHMTAQSFMARPR